MQAGENWQLLLGWQKPVVGIPVRMAWDSRDKVGPAGADLEI